MRDQAVAEARPQEDEDKLRRLSYGQLLVKLSKEREAAESARRSEQQHRQHLSSLHKELKALKRYCHWQTLRIQQLEGAYAPQETEEPQDASAAAA